MTGSGRLRLKHLTASADETNWIEMPFEVIDGLEHHWLHRQVIGRTWLGEVEGLKVSLAGAQDKLAQMQRQIDDRSGRAFLGLPLAPATAASSTTKLTNGTP